MKKLIHLLFILGTLQLSAQLQDGSLAPDFTGVDLDGVEHNLYDLLAEGKSVVLDFSATWCGPCWSYHTGGSLDRFNEEFGPDGTGEAVVFMIEADASTNLDCLYDNPGCNNSSLGDWVTGTHYPIIDDASIGTKYQISAYPTIMMVCPDGKVATLGQISEAVIHMNTSECPSVETAPELRFFASDQASCGPLEVTFTDLSWPRPETYSWDFGDGMTSTEREPTHTYDEPGSYTVTLVGTNAYGEETLVQESLINIGEGNELESSNVGPVDRSIGDGRLFEGGHQGLIFDAYTDIIINSAFVYSGKEAIRRITLHDEDNNLLSITEVDIPEGDLRIDMDIYVPQGSNYRLGLYSDAFMFRNNTGVQYPYEVEDLISIYTSTAGTDPLAYYYYFYDMEVREAGCDAAISVDDIEQELISVYPNPSTDQITVESPGIGTAHVQVYNTVGKLMDLPHTTQTNMIRYDVSSLESGVYVVQVEDRLIKFQKL